MTVVRLFSKTDKCLLCKEAFSEANVFTNEGHKETQISGICERCFDQLFTSDEDAP
jgi:hypothetical protein